MELSTRTCISEEQIRTRSYAIWEADGRQEGRSEEYWHRAKTELEAELECRWWDVALAAKETTDFVMPHLPISPPPLRHESARINFGSVRKAA